jgi:hypothetical protein
MKKVLFVLATMLLLTTVTVPSFADGNPIPHTPKCQSTVCLPPV